MMTASELRAMESRDAAIVRMRREGKLSLREIGEAQTPRMSHERVRQILEAAEPGLAGKTVPKSVPVVYKVGAKLASGAVVLAWHGRKSCRLKCKCGTEYDAAPTPASRCKRCQLRGLRKAPLEKLVAAREKGLSYRALMRKFGYKSPESIRRALRQGEREAKRLAVDEAFS